MTRDGAPRTDPRVEVRRAADRFVTVEPGRTTRHSFSFGSHYDPGNVGVADLVAHNEDLVGPRAGYPEHPHRDLEIVTWVLSGTLRHEDSTGHAGEIRAGTVQRLSAGSGIRHTEVNPDREAPVHFVQMWVLPDEPGLEPSYEQRDVDADLGRGGWVSLASGSQAYADDPAVRLCNSRAVLHAARLRRGESLRLPDPHGARPGETSVLHLFVARGGVEMEVLGELDTGDAARLFGAGGQLLTAPNEAEVLLWEMHPGPR
jgi:redox-sensitive bicupin YhaK (pirin superfamily)